MAVKSKETFKNFEANTHTPNNNGKEKKKKTPSSE
jgi:hypothetical protein